MKEEIIEEYIEIIENNRNKFSEDLLKVLDKPSYDWVIWIHNNKINELDFHITEWKLKIDKIIAPGRWKEIMFLMLFKIFSEWIEQIQLKAEPLRLLNWLTFEEAKSKLINFYWYFAFKLVNNLWNMEFNIDNISENDFKILLNRIKLYINKKTE